MTSTTIAKTHVSLNVSNVEEYLTARESTVCIILLNTCWGWSEINGTTYGSAAGLW